MGTELYTELSTELSSAANANVHPSQAPNSETLPQAEPPGSSPPSIPASPLFSIEFSNSEIGLEGYVCIHSYGKYGASGGMRCVPDVSREEVELLAKAMTYKYSFFRIEQGGAKAGLKLNYDAAPHEKKLLLQSAARQLEPLIKRHLWSPWSDMNFYHGDRADFFAAIGQNIGSARPGGSSFRTALSAYATINAAARHLGIPQQNLRIAIEGFGSVASYLAPLLRESGARLVAYTNRLGGYANPNGVDWGLPMSQHRGEQSNFATSDCRRIDTEELFDIETDIFVPCARVHSINEHRASRIPAAMIIPIANVPATDRGLQIFDDRNVSFIPDFVVNGGGVCGHIMGNAQPDRLGPAQDFLNIFEDMILRFLQLSVSTRRSPRVIACEIADQNYSFITKDPYDTPTWRERIASRFTESLPGMLSSRNRETQARAQQTVEFIDSLFV